MSNNLLSFQEGRVQKRYRSRILYDREHMLLTKLAGTGLVPEIVCSGEISLTLTAVEGPTLLELFEKVWAGEVKAKEGRRLLGLLADWLSAVQRLLLLQDGRTVALEDPHLCNFIVNQSGGSLVGLDFEHWHYGVPEETPAMLLAFLDGYRGAQGADVLKLYDWFRSQLITGLSLDPFVLSELVERCRNRLSMRRLTQSLRRDSTAVILAGGGSRRMGRPKWKLCAGGYSFLERTLEILDSFDHVAVSAGDASCPDFTVPVWQDIMPDCGPMGGLLTALSRAETPLVFLTACDMPDLTEELIFHLFQSFLPEDDCLVPVTNGWIHPLTAIYHTRLLPQVERLVKAGDNRILSLYDVARIHYLPLSAELSAQLININTPIEYEAWLRRYNEGPQNAACGSIGLNWEDIHD